MGEHGDSVTLDFLGRILRDIQADQREQKAELREIRSLLVAQVDHGRRLDRHLSELKDDVEMMLKSELMGRLGLFEMRLDRRLDDLTERVGALEEGRKSH